MEWHPAAAIALTFEDTSVKDKAIRVDLPFRDSEKKMSKVLELTRNEICVQSLT